MKIGIAGAGLLGRLLAWRLLREGHEVSLFDAGSLRRCPGAARTAAAMISPLSEVVDSERSIYDMGMAGLSIWPQWLQELPGNVAYSQQGSWVVAHQQDAPLLRQFQERLKYHLGEEGAYRYVDVDVLREREPDLARFPAAVYLETEAHLDNHHLLDALLSEIQRRGALCFESTLVTDIGSQHISSQQQRYEFDRVLDCRGVGASSAQSPIRGVRGEVLWVETTEVRLQRPVRFMHPRYKLYVVPKPGNRYIIGATEIESEDRSPVSLQSNLELSSALYALNPAFAEARLVDMDVNLRPAFMDNLPRIEVDDGRIHVNGLYRHGYLLAPVVVEAVMALITHTTSDFLAPLLNPKESVAHA